MHIESRLYCQAKVENASWSGVRNHLTAHAAMVGRLLWSCDEFNTERLERRPVASSPVLAPGYLVIACHDGCGKAELQGI